MHNMLESELTQGRRRSILTAIPVAYSARDDVKLGPFVTAELESLKE